MAITLVDHSGKDGTGDAINGSEVDENPNTLNNVLNGVTTTALNASGGMNFSTTPYSTDHKGHIIKVYNNSGGSLAAGALVYISAYNTTESLYEITKAVSAQTTAGTKFATWIANAAVSNATAGYVTNFYPITGIDTSALTQDGHIWLSHTAGTYNTSRTAHPDVDYLKQICGKVARVHATTGSIVLFTPGWVIPWSIADQI